MSATVLPDKCHNCGQYFGPAGARCPHCGCDSWDAAVSVEGVEGKAKVGQVGVAALSRTESGTRIQYKSSVGTESNSEVTDEGVKLELLGTDDIGREGEPTVTERIEDALRARGHAVGRRDAKDDRGEDARLVCDGRTLIIQVVTAPGDPKFLAEAANGSAQIEWTRSAAAGWLEQAIDRKRLRYDPASKQSMLLAIDVRHVGVVVDLIDPNLHDKATAAGFFGVWLVGPTAETTVMLSRS
jgi:hypothetical protein